MKSLKIMLITFSIIISSAGFSAIPLKKGNPAPHDGVLITKQEEAKVKKLSDENKILKKLKFKQSELIENQGKQLKILKRQKAVNGYMNYVYFIGGVLLTGASVYLAGNLRK